MHVVKLQLQSNLAVTMLLRNHVIIHDANMELPLASIRNPDASILPAKLLE